MSGMDNEVFNTRERPVSNDLNDLQSLVHRSVVDMLREMFVKRSFAIGAAATESPRNVVLGGLEVTPSGSDILVATGALMQESSTLAPVPGTLDSNYRVGILRSVATVTPPSPAGDTYFLLEAQMTELATVSESRDILDIPSSTFIPAVVPKQRERRLLFSFVTGTVTEAPVPTGGDFVPLAIVFRPAGGGAVLAFHLTDARTMWDAEAPLRDTLPLGSLLQRDRGQRFVLTTAVPGGAVSNFVIVDAEAFIAPTRLWYTRSGSVDVTLAAFISPGTVLAANTWYYLYLAPWQGIPIVSVLDPFATGRGIIVLSAVAPIAQALLKNSLAIPLPAPFGITSLPGAGGVCIAALRRNSSNNGWVPSWSIDNNLMRIGPGLAIGTFSPMVSPQTISLSGIAPVTAKTAIIQIRITGNGTPATVGQIFVAPVGINGSYRTAQFDDGGIDTFEFPVPLAGAIAFDIRYIGTGAPDIVVELTGWSE